MVPALPARALLLVLAGRTADSLTTAYGLTTDGVHERNPVVAALLDGFGPVGGLLVANLIALATLVAGVEFAAGLCRSHSVPEREVELLRAGSYAAFGVVSFVVAAHNVRVLLAA